MSGQREWKPGDVAMRSHLGETVMSVRVPTCYIDGHQRGQHWHHADGGWDARDGRSTYRPLVVIDPADREQVERLVKVLSTGQPLVGLDPMNRKVVDEAWIIHTQAALREFANPTPPRPDEPMGLGAVVEDGESVLWTHIGNGRWVNDQERHRSFSNVSAVRVLSEGMQP